MFYRYRVERWSSRWVVLSPTGALCFWSSDWRRALDEANRLVLSHGYF